MMRALYSIFLPAAKINSPSVERKRVQRHPELLSLKEGPCL
jgi:hypothetical protein